MSFLKDIARAIGPRVLDAIVPGGGLLLETVARGITGDPEEVPLAEVERKIAEDPALALQYKQALLDHEARLAEIDLEGRRVDAEQLETVNVTMREEGKSEHWPQWAWRPFNGFLYGITIFCTYFVLPLLGRDLPSVPTEIWIGWGAVLGITTWHRGKQKRVQSGETEGAVTGLIKAIRGSG